MIEPEMYAITHLLQRAASWQHDLAVTSMTRR
jgi:hypothetical protein